jgi:autotransporter-associated beta strand protein
VTLNIASISSTTDNHTSLTFSGSGNTTVGAITASTNKGVGTTGREVFITLNQTGTVTFTGANDLDKKTNTTDTFSINNGTLVLDNSASLNSSTNGTGFAFNLGSSSATANNVNLFLGDANNATGGITISRSFNVQDNDSGLITVGGQNTSGVNTFSGNFTMGATSNTGKSLKVVAAAGGEVDFTGAFLRNGTDTTAGITVGDATNTGTVRFAGANSYAGTTTLAGGTLLADSAQALNTSGSGGAVTFTGGSLRYGTSFAAGANADISARIKNSTSAVVIDTNNQTVAFASGIDSTNTGGVTKAGTGTLNLAGTSGYTGTTTVKAGTLIVSGSLSAGSPVIVGDSTSLSTVAQLAGSGYVGDVSAVGTGDANTSGATVDPGNSSNVAGILNTGAFSLTNGAHLALQIGGNTAGGESSTGYDQIVASGLVTLAGGDLKLTVQGTPALTSSDALYLVINNSSNAVVNAFNSISLDGNMVSDPSNITINGVQFALVYNANYSGVGSDGLANDIALLAVPEASTWSLVFGSFGMLSLAQRVLRRRR